MARDLLADAGRSVAASPMTARRTVECPTRKPAFDRDAAVEPVEALGERRASPTAPPLRALSSGMPSTTAIMRMT